MNQNEQWLQWAVELQSLAQAGLYYAKDQFDTERYSRIRDIAAEMMSSKTDILLEKVKDLFCCETGYQTPKLDTRAAIFEDNKILLVHEKNGTWSLPGGWVDVAISVKENFIKEVREEAGLDVEVDTVIAVQDREKHIFIERRKADRTYAVRRKNQAYDSKHDLCGTVHCGIPWCIDCKFRVLPWLHRIFYQLRFLCCRRPLRSMLLHLCFR
ncbi:MAG: NUDIX hydrolase N-terminal domain-containing protein [Lachnospiraceae bacterium]|nr:NUDIX hydrolase N-terminal domain-containing protein [Lachnospiraceae bacterium]